MRRRSFIGGLFGGALAAKILPGSSKASATDSLPLRFVEDKDAAFPVEMKSLKGIALDAVGNILVAGQEGLHVFTPKGGRIRVISSPQPLGAVAVSADGRIFTASRSRINIFDAEGKAVSEWGESGVEEGQFSFITSLVLDGDFVFVADAGNRRVSHHAINGDYVDQIENFKIPSPFFDIAMASSGQLVAANTSMHRIEYFDRNRRRLRYWGKPGAGPEGFTGCCNPCNFAILPDDRVVTTEKGTPRLKLHDDQGKLLAHLGGDAAFTPGTTGMDLTVDAKGRVLLLDSQRRQVRFFEIQGEGTKA
jgi:hypothetical protein